ncbi:conserved hypothetical protein [Coccidioides posadasii str. Silveira]|uniref:Uncharacterized protein n=1 Tax=Coccidioides posadasii (strain RMSCC 757 / Silveira) TaxID=443226 RepID=E9CW17_COCPS|nr:conserved hypothetical protein [Coccidioides posadasii str. Silveira]
MASAIPALPAEYSVRSTENQLITGYLCRFPPPQKATFNSNSKCLARASSFWWKPQLLLAAVISIEAEEAGWLQRPGELRQGGSTPEERPTLKIRSQPIDDNKPLRKSLLLA